MNGLMKMKKIKNKKIKLIKLRGYDYLKKDFEEAVKELQQKCKHPKKGIFWADECWAVGHYSGAQIQVCSFCNKMLVRKSIKYKPVYKKAKDGGTICSMKKVGYKVERFK